MASSSASAVEGADAEAQNAVRLPQPVLDALSGRHMVGLDSDSSALLLLLWSHTREQEFVTAQQAAKELMEAGAMDEKRAAASIESLNVGNCIDHKSPWGPRHSRMRYTDLINGYDILAERIFSGQDQLEERDSRPATAKRAAPPEAGARWEVATDNPVDKTILERLSKDHTITQMSRDTGISFPTIIRRLRAMEGSLTRKETLEEYATRLVRKGAGAEEVRRATLPYHRLGYHWTVAESDAASQPSRRQSDEWFLGSYIESSRATELASRTGMPLPEVYRRLKEYGIDRVVRYRSTREVNARRALWEVSVRRFSGRIAEEHGRSDGSDDPGLTRMARKEDSGRTQRQRSRNA